MSIIKVDYGTVSGGGGGSVHADTSSSVKNITTANTSWTATQDCIMIGTIAAQAGVAYGSLSLDGATVISNINNNTFGNYSSAIGLYIPKNTVVATGGGTYSLTFYPVAP